MIRFQDVIGKQTISIQEGKNFGKIIDVFVNNVHLNIEGFIISDKDDKFLPFNEVKSIGDSIIFNSGEMLLPISEKLNAEIKKGSSINGLKVITEKGIEKGIIASFYFNNDGIITHFEVEKNIFIENLIMSRDAIIKIGEDAVIIYEEAAEIMNEMKKKNNVKITIKKLGKSAEVFTKTIFNKKNVEELKDKSEKIIQKTKNGTVKIKGTVEKTIEKIRKKG
ncbi:MAG: PRC-barrel domain-containing protein [Candidatus Goldbacteria bacterium]|nr:PRC-barrel domain-containing protein [Candidatus Goldiibacteriota bacterium]HPD18475.1 PRC-barrel domain-containing protein [Candidatus Goldiibacteriota bacterium]